MNVKRFVNPKEQVARIGKHKWHVARLFQLAKELDVMDVPLEHIAMDYNYEGLTLRELAGHMVAVNEANLKYPIILDEDGVIMDGRHRLIKSLVEGKKTIKAVRFKETPPPCEVIADD